jgi:hypothetical protein
MGLRGQVKRLERAAREEMIQIRRRDGTVKVFGEADYIACFLHEYERGARHFDGEEPGPAHPMIEALRGAPEGEVERLVPTLGTLILNWLGEDEVIRGERERPGPPVRETSPGVYE